MGKIRAESSAVIDAPPETVYAIIADYREGHPKILPQEHFKDLQVESGGQGEGTVITFRTRAAGRERPYRMEITEPEPGRVLRETDKTANTVTTFTVTPLNEGRQSRVQIVTEYDASPSIAGFFEKMLAPSVMRGIYEKELRQLAQVASDAQSKEGKG